MRFITLHKERLPRLVLSLLFISILVSSLVVNVVKADDKDFCPEGMSTLDCKAIFGNWVNWIPNTGSCDLAGGGGELVGADNAQKGFNYFVSQGLSDVQSAAIIGNFLWESHMDPSIHQGGGGPGRGIAQWSVDGRWVNLLKYADQQSEDPLTLRLQLDYSWQEFQGNPPANDYSSVLKDLKSETDISDATTLIMNDYEQAGDKDSIVYRIAGAKEVLDNFAEGGGGVVGTGGGCSASSVDCQSPGTGGLSQIRQNVVCTAKAELQLWTEGKLTRGTDFHKYSEGRDENWCADFASWVYNEAGYPLQAPPAGWNVPAVTSIMEIGQKEDRFHWHPAGQYIPQPGDLIIHKDGESHVNIVESVNPKTHTMTELGGNQHGGGGYQNNEVTHYQVSAFSGTDGITGYVSPD